ncbi:MAG: response regulator, partial [Dehalococcoidia bacterium]|nr:response regulator [Dehalococcoidia bacterium]
MRVLYIEDEEAAVEAVRMRLSRASPAITMEAAATMREGLSRLRRRHDYDLVLTDTRLPDGDGLAVLAHIRGRSLPVAVVLTTGAGDEESAVAALKAGADDYIAERPGYLVGLPQRLLEAAERRRVEVSRLSRPLRVLYLEDSQQDAEQVISHLARSAPHIRVDVVGKPAEMLKRVSSDSGPDYQVLLLDCKLPGMDGLELLAEIRRTCVSDIAVVLITALGNEEVAVQALRLGASDYVAKRSGYLLKLPSVLDNAYYRTSLERARGKLLQSEEKYRTLVEHLPVVVYTTALDRTSAVRYIGPRIKELLGYGVEEWQASPGNWGRSLHPDDKAWVVAERARCNAQVAPFEAEYRMVAKDGRLVWVSDRASVVRDASGQPAFRQGVVYDITNRKVMEMAL